jgi:hypothetical protein
MTDLSRLAEAVEHIAATYYGHHEDGLLVLDAARSVLTGQDVRWCDVHNSVAGAEICQSSDLAARRMSRNPFDKVTCSIVSRRLITLKGTE